MVIYWDLRVIQWDLPNLVISHGDGLNHEICHRYVVHLPIEHGDCLLCDSLSEGYIVV